MKEFNINNYVSVKLTDFGIAILRQKFEQDNPGVGEFEISIDENGYTEMQLVDLMKIFGGYLSYDQSRPIPFETSIMISEQRLEETSIGKNIGL